MNNSFGERLVLTTFGESHGPAVGGVLDGFPSRFRIDFGRVAAALASRAPSCVATDTSRREPDEVEWLSGILDGVTLGTPIAFIVRNVCQRSCDYDALRHVYRPSHADLTYDLRYGIRDYRGGGRASARETVARVVAGSLAEQWLEQTHGVTIETSVTMPDVIPVNDSVGSAVHCSVKGMPAGKGTPLFSKLQARLADAMFSIPACRSFEYGSGAASFGMSGSVHNDQMEYADGHLRFLTNHAGGILGGISTGEEIMFDVVFKPVPSISLPQHTVTDDRQNTLLTISGRHDRVIAPRAAAVVRSMTALTLMDQII
ncbi:MAG: chorismate synthase [Paludibacteraceae bacterium]|nr:chorismate synthase [Paludibacteraceae bacterium]